MSRIDAKAGKKFRIFHDVDKRQQQLEEHAIQLILKRTANPNLPMIPDVESARVRKTCHFCSAPMWGVDTECLCLSCQKQQDMEIEMNRELNAISREVRMAELEAKRSRLEELRTAGASAQEIVESLGPPRPSFDEPF